MNRVERATATAAVPVEQPEAEREPPLSPAPESIGVSPRSPRLRPLIALRPYIMRYRGRVSAALVALIAAAAATLVLPIAVRGMIDHGFTHETSQLIDRYFFYMIGVAAVLALASASRAYLVMTLGERVVADLRSSVFAHLVNLSADFFDTAKTGEMISRLTADTTQIKAAAGSSVSVALRNLLMFVGAAIMMVVTSPWLSAFVLAAIPIIILPLVGLGRGVRRRSRAAQDTLADASAYASELIGATRVLQAFTHESIAIGRFTGAVERAYHAACDQLKARSALIAIAIFLVFSSVVVILWLGARGVNAGTISSGTLSQFVLYAVLASAALSELSQVGTELAAASGAAERLFELLAIHPTIRAPARPTLLPAPGRGEVAFEAVRFAYPTRPAQPVLDGVSFRIKPGEKVAIVGPSGAGKSTIFHLLLRFYDPLGGRVTFDGVPLTDLDPADLRRHIALVPQDSVVFAASVYDNIRFGRPEATDAEVEHAANLALASEFIERLPQRFDSPIGERGVTLSGGQRQRIAIARAILRDAPLLLLDEATASLDAESEALVQAALERLMEKRTTLVIAHRFATVLSCDRLIVMERGRIVEQGTHDQLAAGGGLYARLAKLQFEGA